MSVRITLISQFAFYPMHWEAFRVLCTDFDVRGSVLACMPPEMPEAHKQLGWVTIAEARREPFAPDVRQMPAGSRRQQRRWLKQQLDELQSQAIWVQEEPTNRVLLDVLSHFRRNPSPRIIGAIAENLFRLRPWRRWTYPRLWRRLDRLMAVASPSVESIRRVGMPASVPADVLVAGATAPPASLTPLPLPLDRQPGDFVVGFAGRVCPEKGWNVLFDAVEMLPREFKVAVAGSGPDVEVLQQRLRSSALGGRAAYLGLLPKAELWRFYGALDCLATPHRTFPHWKEQFGGVLADAMALGLPIVGSDSGSIPEVVGPAGLIVPENDAPALAAALRRLRDEPLLHHRFAEEGRARFEREFSIPAYARKIAAALDLKPRRASNVRAA